MSEGSLFEFMEKKIKERIDETTCLRIFRQICHGIYVMHHMNPPLCHRDLKIENVLFDGKNFKLCDFGSVSAEVIDFK
jgi:AP2-associated kinase